MPVFLCCDSLKIRVLKFHENGVKVLIPCLHILRPHQHGLRPQNIQHIIQSGNSSSFIDRESLLHHGKKLVPGKPYGKLAHHGLYPLIDHHALVCVHDIGHDFRCPFFLINPDISVSHELGLKTSLQTVQHIFICLEHIRISGIGLHGRGRISSQAIQFIQLRIPLKETLQQ